MHSAVSVAFVVCGTAFLLAPLFSRRAISDGAAAFFGVVGLLMIVRAAVPSSVRPAAPGDAPEG